MVLFACNVFGESKKIAELRKKAEAGDAEAACRAAGGLLSDLIAEMRNGG